MTTEILRIGLITNLLTLSLHRPGMIQTIGGILYLCCGLCYLWCHREAILSDLRRPRSLAGIGLRWTRSLIVSLFLVGVSGDPWLTIYAVPRIPLLLVHLLLTGSIHALRTGSLLKLAEEIRTTSGLCNWVVIPLFMLYLCNSTSLITSDSRGNGLLPFSIEDGRLDLDEFVGKPEIRHDKEGLDLAKNSELVDILARPLSGSGSILERGYILHSYHLVPVNMHFYNMFPLLPGFANTLVLLGVQSMGLIPEYRAAVPGMESSPLGVVFDNSVNLLRITAAFQAAVAVGLLLVFLLRRLTVAQALAISLLYALASFHYSLTSQALWQHGLGELLAIALLCMVDPLSKSRKPFLSAMVFGFLLALLVATRPTNVAIAGVMGLYVLFTNWRSIPGIALGGIPTALAVVAINMLVYNHPLGGYGHWRVELFYQAREGGSILGGNVMAGAAGLLLSPGRGLLFHMPYLIAAFYGAWILRRDSISMLCVALVFAQTVFFSLTPFWSGGVSYGPRYLLESLPFWMVLLVPIIRNWPTVSLFARIPFALSALFAFFAQLSPVITERPFVDWNLNPHINLFPERLWDFRDAPVLASISPYRSAFLNSNRFYAAYASSQHGWTEQDVIRSSESESGYLRVKTDIKTEGVWIVLKMPLYLRRGSYTVTIRTRATSKSGTELKLVTEGESSLAPISIAIPESDGFQLVSTKIAIQKSSLKSFSILAKSNATVVLDYIEVTKDR